MGGSSDPSVPRSPGATLQEQAGRPMGPSTLQCEFPWEFVDDYAGLLSRLFGLWSVFCRAVVFPRVGECVLVRCALHDPTGVCCLRACPLRFFLCLVLSSTPCLSLCFSLSFPHRRWGNPNLFGLGFPLCSRGHDLLLRPVPRGRHLHQGFRPHLFFFFFLSLLDVARFSGGWWWLVVFDLGLSLSLSLSRWSGSCN